MHRSSVNVWNLAECCCSTNGVGALVGSDVSSVMRTKLA
jgi:hypothetical protein